MSSNQKIEPNFFYSALDKAWQPIWLANFIYCYLFIDIISFFLNGNGIFNYPLTHIVDINIGSAIITITIFGLFSIFFLPCINIIVSHLFLSIPNLSNYMDAYVGIRKTRESISLNQLSDKDLIKKFENNPEYLNNIYNIEKQKITLQVKHVYKFENLILGIIIFCILEMFIINCDKSNTLYYYLNCFLENNEIVFLKWIINILILFILCYIYCFFCYSNPNIYFNNPILYEYIQDLKKK